MTADHQEQHSIQLIKAENRRNRSLVRMLAISIVFDVLLTIAIGIIGFNNYSTGTQLRAETAQRCISENATRAADTKLWTLALADAPPAQTPQVQQEIDQFKQNIHVLFAPIDCKS